MAVFWRMAYIICFDSTLCTVSFFTKIIRVIKSRRMRWAG
jgi:hypothetical protein